MLLARRQTRRFQLILTITSYSCKRFFFCKLDENEDTFSELSNGLGLQVTATAQTTVAPTVTDGNSTTAPSTDQILNNVLFLKYYSAQNEFEDRLR